MNLNKEFFPGILPIVYYHWVKSLQIKIFGQDMPPPVAYLFWHSKMFPLPYTHRRRGIRVLVSEHQDTIWIVRILKALGFTLARGSSSKGGRKGAISLLRAIQEGKSIAITPDGPKGPREEVKESVIYLLKMANVPIIPVGVGYKRKVVLNTWDRLEIPYPLTKCAVVLGEPINPSSLTDGSNELLKNRLKVVNRRAEGFVSDESYI